MTSTIVPEPAPRSGAPRLRFAVQKHWARSLHYDFRLEIETALVSWAVPKGPSKDPNVKRLAIHVEDHPIDYLLFEGGLPEGEYGAGEVIVWDFGDYEIVEPAGTDAAEALRDGIVRFALHGTKLRENGRSYEPRWDRENVRTGFCRRVLTNSLRQITTLKPSRHPRCPARFHGVEVDHSRVL